VSTQPKTFLTPEQYLEIERQAEFRHEYREGESVERAVSNEAHVLLVGNIAASLNRQLRSRRPEVYMCDMRVRVNARVSSGIRAKPAEQWLLTAADRLEDTVALESIDCKLRLADIYENIDLGPIQASVI